MTEEPKRRKAGVRTLYSPEQDEQILAAKFEDLAFLSARFARTLTSIKSRRTYLRNKRAEYAASYPEPAVKKAMPQRFARPAWFKEDLSQLSKVR